MENSSKHRHAPARATMRPLQEFPRDEAACVHTVFTDIDDTLTTDGRLPAAAYAALERLCAAGVAVVPVTGRPAGWCDLIARQWPVRGVVGENGAFHFSYDKAARRMRRAYWDSPEQRAENRQRLARIRSRILAEIPGSAVSADQAYREADLAIDFCEDVPPLPLKSARAIKAIFEEEGAVAKISSIHVNGWFGSFDKLAMSKRFARDVLGYDLQGERARVVFCGDSPNDAPMFAFFPNACAVANVRAYGGELEAQPAWVAQASGGEGFVEIADHILRARDCHGVDGR